MLDPAGSQLPQGMRNNFDINVQHKSEIIVRSEQVSLKDSVQGK